MNVFILGICGTFMGGIAAIAKQSGFNVSGSDAGVYPPMSDCLRDLGIDLCEGFDPKHLQAAKPDVVIVGNALSRGNPSVEWLLNQNIPFVSGPAWLAQHVLCDRWTIAVAGTHGKTTTTSILTWLLTCAGKEPGFLVGGVMHDSPVSANLGKAPYFVIEADEYDTAFFDKRPKFIHYHPKTAILNNLEFDHADIYDDLAAIEKQFHYLVRTVSGEGRIIRPVQSGALDRVQQTGCWTPVETFGVEAGEWRAEPLNADASQFRVKHQGKICGEVSWQMFGTHNMQNALAAIAAANHVGISLQAAIDYLGDFKGIKRRLEVRGCVNEITVYDDFAHHPTAIGLTLEALRNRVNDERIIAIVHFASNSMATGVHLANLAPALIHADEIIFAIPEGANWTFDKIKQQLSQPITISRDVSKIIEQVTHQSRPKDHVLIMSNKGFGGIHTRLLTALEELVHA